METVSEPENARRKFSIHKSEHKHEHEHEHD